MTAAIILLLLRTVTVVGAQDSGEKLQDSTRMYLEDDRKTAQDPVARDATRERAEMTKTVMDRLWETVSKDCLAEHYAFLNRKLGAHVDRIYTSPSGP